MIFSKSKFLTIVGCSLLISNISFSQKNKKNKKEEVEEPIPNWTVDTLIKPIPANRALFTDYVDKQIKLADLRDGQLDQTILLKDTVYARVMNQVMMQQIPKLQIKIENIEAEHQTKILYHRALEKLAKKINSYNYNMADLYYIKNLADNFESLLLAREMNNVATFVQSNANIFTLDNSDLLDGFPQEKAYVFEKVGTDKPEMMISRLSEFAKESYADPVVAAAAKVVPGTVLKYAMSTSYLSSVVKKNKDPLVQSIVKIANESSAPWAILPFLKKIHDGSMTVKEADNLKKNGDAYMKALVDLKTENTTLGLYDIDQELKITALKYIRLVNELHNSPAPVRFKSLTNFRSQDLYFMMIAGQDEIYTSSFTWMFNKMMQDLNGKSGKEFLDLVNNYHFRTFLRMCAGYNTLTPFLASMSESEKTGIMHNFVSNLEVGDFEDLEGAVDVADAYGSIHDENLKAFIKNEVKENYARIGKIQDERKQQKGTIVYGLLSTIFESADNPELMNSELSQFIPPIMYVRNGDLKDSTGRVYEVSYFYGDQDGKTAYASYINSFNKDPKWKVQTTSYWTTITHEGPHPITIFANRPLPEETGEDEKAQKELAKYLETNEIYPTVVIHRGHSYYLPTTLTYLTESAKIVMLGSCGGYHSLAGALEGAPDAHIISSKQVGALNVNEPIIKAIDKRLMEGKDVNWLDLWSELTKFFSTKTVTQKDLFSDYIPPNRNLGVIFIKAYKKMAASLN